MSEATERPAKLERIDYEDGKIELYVTVKGHTLFLDSYSTEEVEFTFGRSLLFTEDEASNAAKAGELIVRAVNSIDELEGLLGDVQDTADKAHAYINEVHTQMDNIGIELNFWIGEDDNPERFEVGADVLDRLDKLLTRITEYRERQDG